MQRAAFPELQGRPRPSRHRRQDRPDRVLIGLKIATFVAACGLVGVIVLLMGGGSDVATSAAAPPKIGTGQSGDDAPRSTPTPVTPKAAIDPPALRTETGEITRAPTSSKHPRPTSTTPTTTAPAPRVPAVGEPCPEPGAWSMTPNFEPVYCPVDGTPRWHRVF